MRAMMSLTKKYTNLDADTFEWMHPLAFAVKSNSYYNPTCDESMNVPQKGRYCSECNKEINKLNEKHAWVVADREECMYVLLSNCYFKHTLPIQKRLQNQIALL